MKKLLYSTLIFGVLIGAGACRKYVEIPPEQTRSLRYTSDYQQLLNNTAAFDNAYYMPVFSGDDIGSSDVRWMNSLFPTAQNAYVWAERLFPSDEEDTEWSSLYRQIFICNTVTNSVMDSEGGSPADKQKAFATALLHRSFNYFTLVNLYAKQYDPATADKDPGVPIVLEPRFNLDLTRVSIRKVYNQIIADLNTALPSLPDVADYSSNGSKVAVYSVLARVYLNTREFSEAKRYADLALSLQNTLLNLNDYVASTAKYPIRTLNPEEIFFKVTAQYPVSFPLSQDAINMYDVKDLRFALFTVDGSTLQSPNFDTRAYWKMRITNDGTYVGPSVPEMLLIKAECEARTNNAAAAISTLNSLRKKRFKPEDYADLNVTTPDAALRLTIDERKREFVGRGFRWFDQRRLSQDAGFVTTITRTYKDKTYTLAPGGNRYTFPIGDGYIRLNPEIVQNPR